MVARTQIVALVMFLFAHGVSLRADNLPEALSKLSPGRRIEVRLNSGDRLIGHLGAVDVDSLVLDPDKPGGSLPRVLPFKDVRSVKPKMTAARKWAIGAGVYGALVVLGLVLGK